MKTDTKALALAYIGCLILTAALIVQLKYDINWHYNLILSGCVIIAGCFFIKDSDYWEYAIKKVWKNRKIYKYISIQ